MNSFQNDGSTGFHSRERKTNRSAASIYKKGWLFLPLLVLLAAVIIAYAETEKPSSPGNAEQTIASPDPELPHQAKPLPESFSSDPLVSHAREKTDKPESSQSNNDIPMKWIPNLKILAGAPPTSINLDDAISQFVKDGVFGDPKTIQPKDLKVSVVSDIKENIVIPEFDGRNLILYWPENGTGNTDVVVKISSPDNKQAYVSFKAEVWKPNYFLMLTIVIGGLGLFLLGMKYMSEGLQSIAGAGLRRMIALFTDNRLLAVGIGILTTTLVQSSSVTTVMVIGFINSQLMTLTQGIGVIMGTNIGTTTTGWLLTLNVGAWGLPIVGISEFFFMFCKNEKIRFLSMSTLGLGLIFFGLKTMESGLAPLPEIPEFSIFMKTFAATTLFGAFKCVLVGCLLTMMVQSSAATIGITMALASLGAIEFSTAAALVLGENIGTTITALLASIGASANARRAAYFHSIFNIIGVCWVLSIFFPILLPLVVRLAQVEGTKNIAAGIAMTHSLFNITNTLVFLPFTGIIASLLTKYVKGAGDEQKHKTFVTSLAIQHRETPIIGIERSRIEIMRMASSCEEITECLKKADEGNFLNRSVIDEAFHLEETLDKVQDEVIDFIAKLMAENLTKDLAASAREQVRLAEEFETISDYLIGVLKSNLKMQESGLALPDEIHAYLAGLHKDAALMIAEVRKTYSERKSPVVLFNSIDEKHRSYIPRVKGIRGKFAQMMFSEKIDPAVIIAVNYQLNAYRRISEHLLNIVEAMVAAATK